MTTLREKLAQIMYEDVICDTVYDDDIQRERAYVDDPYHAADAILAAFREALTSEAAVQAAVRDYCGVNDRGDMYSMTHAITAALDAVTRE